MIAPLFKGGSLVVFAAAALRACTPVMVEPLEDPTELGAEQEQVSQDLSPEPEDPGPPVVPAADLAPFPTDDPRALAATSLRAGLDAFEQGDFTAALTSLDAASAASDYASALVAQVRGDTLQRLDRPTEAEAAWAAIPPDSRLWQEATLARARLALEEGRPNGALRLLGDSGAPTPADAADLGTVDPASAARTAIRADVLRARAYRARAAEGDEAAAYTACVRVWTTEGRPSSEFAEAEACMQELEAVVPGELHPGLPEAIRRSVALGALSSKDAVVELLDDRIDDIKGLRPDDPALACDGIAELGRAWHKKRKYDRSVPLLEWASENCPTGETRIKAHYSLAQGRSRSGRKTEAIATWISLADRYPEHSYADDGLYHAGTLYTELGNPDSAQQTFTMMADRFPNGDMVGAGLWGLAWSELSRGQHAAAIPWLERVSGGDAYGSNRGRILQSRYWLARSRLAVAVEDDAMQAALGELEALAKDEPLDWYGVLALWRVAETDPDRASAIARSTRASLDALKEADAEPAQFVVEADFLERPGATEAVELLRGGFKVEAGLEVQRALGPDPHERWSYETLLYASHLLEASGDHYRSHHILRLAFRERWPRSEEQSRPLMVHAYPLAFHDPIVEVTSSYSWSPLTFQGLVREESAFSPTIRSWAGAMGLSQLMWPTAKATARKMGIRGLRRTDLNDPKTNLNIGATYFQGLYKRWGGHLPLAMASYNAGPGAVSKWVDARGDMELDGWVETIPYKQTRLYVKKVTASWQTYHALYTDDPTPFVPLRSGPVRAALTRPDPTLTP